MNFFDILQIIKGYLYRQIGERDFDKTDSYIEKVRKNQLGLSDPVYLKILNTKIIKENLSFLIETNIETYTRKDELLEFDNKFNSLIDNSEASKDDSIHRKEIHSLILKGMDIMKKSSDPFHDMGHIMRCLKYAKILLGIYKEKYKLDWGTLVLAVVWHDVSRAIIDTWLYDRKNTNSLGRIPLLLDFYIIKDGLTDSKKSAKLFQKICRGHGIDKEVMSKVAGAINDGMEQGIFHKNKIKNNIYYKLHSDIDFLDVYSIARFESAMRNIVEDNNSSIQFFQRCILISALLLKFNRNSLNFEESRHMYDFTVYNLYKFGQVFYPEDTERLIEPYIKRYTLPAYR